MTATTRSRVDLRPTWTGAAGATLPHPVSRRRTAAAAVVALVAGLAFQSVPVVLHRVTAALAPTSTSSAAAARTAGSSTFSRQSDGTLSVVNAASGLSASYAPHGLSVRADGGTTVGIATTGFGRGGQVRALPTVAPSVTDTTAIAQRGPVTEWVHSRTTGLEQGWTIARRPAGSGPIELTLSVHGAGVTRLSTDALNFAPRSGPAIVYSHLAVRDATGRVLPSSFVTDGSGTSIRINDAHAAYPIVIDPDLTAVSHMDPLPNAGGYAFGNAVVIKDRWMVIGAQSARLAPEPTVASGLVFVYHDATGNGDWQIYTSFSSTYSGSPYVPPTYTNTTGFGSAVGLLVEPQGMTLFARLASLQVVTVWTIAAPGGDPNDVTAMGPLTFKQSIGATQWAAGGGVGDFGSAFDAEGNLLAAGAPQSTSGNGPGIATCSADTNGNPVPINERIGTAEVFQRSGGFGTNYAYVNHIDPPNGINTPIATRSIQQWFGGAIAIDPTTGVVAVGARGDGGATPTPSGATCTQSGGVWSWTGAPATAGTTNWTGAVDVFTPNTPTNPTTWTMSQRILSASQPAQARFGTSLAFTGAHDGLVVGAPQEQDAGQTFAGGAAYLFDQSAPGAWTQTQAFSADDPGTPINDPTSFTTQFGTSVAASPDGTRIYLGAPGETYNTANSVQGAVQVWQRSSDTGPATYLTTVQGQTPNDAHGGIAESLGSSVAANATSLVAGAPAYGEPTATFVGRVDLYKISGTTYSGSGEAGPAGHTFGSDFGWTIAQDGDVMAVAMEGRYAGSGYGAGAVGLYDRDSHGNWNLEKMMFPDAGNYTGSIGNTFDGGYGYSLALHVYRDSTGKDTGLALAIGTPGASFINPGGVGTAAAVSISQTGNVGIWTRNGGPGTAFTHGELFEGGQEQTSSNPASTSAAEANAHFGWSLAFTGDSSLIVGVPGSNANHGAIQRFEGTKTAASSWTFQQNISSPGNNLVYGTQVAADGNQVVTVSDSSSGQAIIYRYTDGTPSTDLTPEPSIVTGVLGAYNDKGLAISGNRIAIGTPSGSAFSAPACTYALCKEQVEIYRMSGDVAVQEALLSSQAGDLGQDPRFGNTLDFNHGGSVTTLAVGANGYDPSTPGQAFVYVAQKKADGSATWSRAATLQPTDTLPGTPLIHTGTYRTGYGSAISNWPNNGGIQVSAPDAAVTGTRAGRIYDFDPGSIQPPPGPQASVDVSVPPTMQVGATQLKTGGLPPSLLSQNSQVSGSIAAAGIGSIDLSQAPVGTAISQSPIASIPIHSIPIASIPIHSIPLSDIPLSGVDGGWTALLAGTAFADSPLQSITLDDVYTLPSVQALPLGALQLAGSPIASIPIASIALGNTPLSNLPLDPSSTDSAITQWCAALTAAGADPGHLGLDCSNPDAAHNTGATMLSIGLKGAPIHSIPIASIPIHSIPIHSIPIASIPIASIALAGTPIASIPIASIALAGTPIASIPIHSIPIASIPIHSIPIASITLAGTPIASIPMSSVAIAGTPIASIPIHSIPIASIPIHSIPIASIPIHSITIGGTTLDAMPLSAIAVASTPIASIPIHSIPIASIPIHSIPIASIPIHSIPIASIPIHSITINGTPIASIPIHSIDIGASPIHSIPIASIDAASRSSLVDCTLIDCTKATIGDAAAAGALKPDATLGLLDGHLSGVRLSDLIGAGGITADQIRAALGSMTLGDLNGFDDLTIGDLPPIWPYLTLGQIQAQTGGARYGDIAEHMLDFTSAQMQDALNNSGLTMADISDWSDVTLGEVTTVLQYLKLGDLGPALSGIRLGDLANIIANPSGGKFSADDLRAALDQAMPGATLGDVSDFDNLTLGELGAYGNATLGDLFGALSAAEGGKITFGDLLLSLLNPRQYPWDALDLSQVETQALDASPNGTPVTVSYRSDAPDGHPQTVRVTVELPAGSRLDTRTIGGDGSADELTPTIAGDTAVWTFANVPSGAPRALTFKVDAPMTIGPATVKATALIPEWDAVATDSSATTITEAFEPNDTIAAATPLADDTITMSHISHAGDIDVYKFDVTKPGTRVSLSLSNLDADLDMVLYAPRDGTITATSGQTLNPVDDSGSSNLPAANQVGSTSAQPSAGNATATPSDLGSLAVVQGSFNRGRSNEQIDTGVLSQTGTYYLAVSGYNGAADRQPYALRLKRFVSNAQPSCPARQVTPGTVGTSLPSTLPAGTNTVFVVNQSRMAGLYGSDGAGVVDNLNAFTTWLNSQNIGEQATVLTVDADQGVRDAYAAWDASPCLPSGANGVVSQIARILNTYRANGADLKNVVLVGGDDAVPFARVPDRTTVANETGYSSYFSDQGNALYATSATGNVQTDNAYVDRSPYAFGDRTLYIPDTTIGRLVETPKEIGDQLTDFEHANGKLAVKTGLVTGYDFLSDGAQNVATQLKKTVGTVDSSLISETWTRQQLQDAIASIKPNILSINSHFDHYRALPGAGNTTGDETDLFTAAAVRGSLNGDLAGSVVFSMGCHSGLSAGDLDLPPNDPRALDFAQAVSSQGGVFVGNTGFGYGDTDTIALSETLMGDFAQRLDGSMSVGQALLYAKNAYFSSLATYTPYDEKVLQESTFYGLPFYTLDVPNPPSPPTPVSPTVTPDNSTGLSSVTTHVQPTLVNRTGADNTTYVAATDPNTGLDTITTVQGRPVEPKTDTAYALPTGKAAHDGLVLGLTSSDYPNVDPYVFQPIVDSSGERSDVAVDTAFPTSPVQVNAGLEPAGSTFHVAATTGYFRTTGTDGTGIQRNYNSMDVETFLPPASTTDWTAPTFSQVTGQVINGSLAISAHASDDQGGAGGVKRVYLLLLQDPAAGVPTVWRSLDLVRTAGTDEWTGSLPTTGRNLEFILQAVDASGNVGITTDKAENFSDAPILGAISASGGTGGGTVDPLTVTLNGTQGGGGWYTGPVTVTAQGGDQLVYEIVGEKAPAGYQAPFQVNGTGLHSVRITSGDGQTQTVSVPIDTVGPVARLDSPAPGQSEPAAPGTLITYSCPDAGSGSTTCAATLDGHAVASGTTTPLPPGSHTIVVTAGPDIAGNAASVPTLTRTFTVVPAPATVGTIGVTKPADGAVTTLSLPFSGYSVLTYSGNVAWGDGSTTNCAMAGSGCTVTRNASGGGVLTVTHTYATSLLDTTAWVAVTDNLGQSAATNVVVNKRTTTTVTPALLKIGGNGLVTLYAGSISATLKDAGGTGLAGRTVTFTLPSGTVICTATTNASGTASCPSTIVYTVQMVLAGKYVATFAGRDAYHGSTATGSLIG